MELEMGNKEDRVGLKTLNIKKREIVTKFLKFHNLKVSQDNLDKMRGTNLGFELNQKLKGV